MSLPPAHPVRAARLLIPLTAFLIALAIQLPMITRAGNKPPWVGDAVENHNIAWNLAHGRGYAFDWNDPQWRKLFAGDRIMLARQGAGPTASRPPLVPLIGAVVLSIAPRKSFVAMRITDAFLLAISTALIAGIAFDHAGLLATVISGLLCAVDPVRMVVLRDVWMTEPASTFLVAALLTCWAYGRAKPAVIGSTVVIGLLMLARGSFIPLIPGLVLITGWSFHAKTRRSYAVILLACCVIPLAWWVRNCVVLDAFMPLGTQGGFNLPDEYSDQAVANSGIWTGAGMRQVWLRHWGDESLLPDLAPDGFPTPEHLQELWPGGEQGFGWMIYALTSGHIGLEREMARSGQWAGIGWIVDHPLSVPGLMLAKAWSEISPFWVYLLLPIIAAALTATQLGNDRLITAAWAFLALGLAGIMLTHSVHGRFLVPYMPALYLLSGIGIARMRSSRAHLFSDGAVAGNGGGGDSRGTIGTSG